MAETKLIALDLDGTLLNTSKQLTKRNEEALRRAAREGVQIVPATGRIYEIIPDFIRSLDFVNYMIVANGSWVMKMSDMSVAYRAEIPCGSGKTTTIVECARRLAMTDGSLKILFLAFNKSIADKLKTYTTGKWCVNSASLYRILNGLLPIAVMAL